ncbi:MAG: hypothetical protein CEE38_13935 [Planctomycetes bacterium B3_Pla]|nr:MAG: hypothetical protein CEE38_13935 [Planctomycetes bacterium B3_Pla]
MRLQRIEVLLTVLVKNQLSDVINKELGDSKKKKIYELTGKYSASEIGKKVGTSAMTVSRLWQGWENLGLLVKDGKGYRRII